MPTLSVSEWTLGASTTAESIGRVAAAGYPAIELAATDALDARAAREQLDSAGLTASSLCGLSDAERDCADASPLARRLAGEYLRRSLEQAAELGAPLLIVVPTYNPSGDLSEREAELERAAQTIGDAARSAGPDGPVVALEALNRYETHLIRTLAEAEELRARIAEPNIRLMADVFHMNIEEDSIPAAISAHLGQLVHVHLADSQRREPGTGHLDFGGVFAALGEGGYAGAMAMEFLPATDEAMVAGRAWVEARVR